jgi:hypothetical protein
MSDKAYIDGDTLRAFRRDVMGMKTSTRLAESLDLNPQHFTKLERGVYAIDKRTALAVLWVAAHGDPGGDGAATFASADGSGGKEAMASAGAAALETLAVVLYGQIAAGQRGAQPWTSLTRDERDKFRRAAELLTAERG